MYIFGSDKIPKYLHRTFAQKSRERNAILGNWSEGIKLVCFEMHKRLPQGKT
jgi:hypothetical protein